MKKSISFLLALLLTAAACMGCASDGETERQTETAESGSAGKLCGQSFHRL